MDRTQLHPWMHFSIKCANHILRISGWIDTPYIWMQDVASFTSNLSLEARLFLYGQRQVGVWQVPPAGLWSQMSLYCTVAYIFSPVCVFVTVLSSSLSYSLCSWSFIFNIDCCNTGCHLWSPLSLCISVCLSCSLTVPRRRLRLVTSVTVHITSRMYNALLWLSGGGEDRPLAHTTPHMYNTIEILQMVGGFTQLHRLELHLDYNMSVSLEADCHYINYI